MVQKTKRPDKLVAGVLALLTAFSPVASVVPVYASRTEDGYGNSITMDPDSIQINEEDGIVLDQSSQDSDGITVVDGDDRNSASGSGDIVIDHGDSDGSGDIMMEDPEQSDGIVIENPDDGISIDESDDGISINDEFDDGITMDESGNILIDPWSEIGDMTDDDYFSEHPDEFELYDRLCALNADIHSIHGSVTFMPADSDDPADQRIVRVIRSEDTDEYTAIATDGNGKEVYRELIDDSMGLPWYQFVEAGTEYFFDITADDGYFLYDCSVSDRSGSSMVTELYSDEWSYKGKIFLMSDVNIVANFSDIHSDSDSKLDQSVSVNSDKDSIVLVDAGSNLMDQTTGNDVDASEESNEDSEPVMLETEVNQLGYEEVFVAGEMADDLEVPDSVEPDSDSAYEDYIVNNLDSSVVDPSKLEFVHTLTLVDTTYDDSMIDKYELGYICDYNPDALITGNTYIQNVYDVGDDTYYVSFVDTQHFNVNSRVFECGVARNNNSAEVFYDGIYDDDTGIVYIPKEHFGESEGVRVQMCQALDCKMDYRETAFCVRLNDDIFMSSFDMFRDYTSIYIDRELDPSYLDVFINGRLADTDECSYDASTGELVIYHPGSLISFLDIKDTRNLGTRVLNALFPVSVVQAAISDSKQKALQSAGKIEVSGTVKNGEVYDGNADLFYWGGAQKGEIDTANLQRLLKKHGFGNCSIVGSYGVLNIGANGDLTNILDMQAAFMDFVVDVSSMSLKKSPYSFSNIDGGKNNIALVLGCNEYSSYNNSAVLLGGAKTEEFGDSTAAARGAKIRVKVANHWTEGDKKYVTFGIVTSRITTQLGSGLIKFEYGEEEEQGPKYIRLRKTIANTYKESWEELSDNNNYQLGGCIFGIYTDENSAENAPVLANTTKDSASILDSVGENNLWKRGSTDEDGYTKFFKVTDKNNKLLYDKLYIVELKAPYGFRIPLESSKHYVTEIDLRSMFPDAARSASPAASVAFEDDGSDAVEDGIRFDSDLFPAPSGTLMRAASSSSSDKVGYILLGDSRFYGYVYAAHDKVSGGSNNGNGNVGSQCSIKMKDDPNTFVVAEVGGGLSYAKGTGVKDINNIKKQYPTIKKWVLLATLGGNDISPTNTSKPATDYANFYKSLKGDFDKILVTSYLPTEAGADISNAAINDYNKKLKSAISGLNIPKIQYMNLKSDFEALNPKFASDHVHFDAATYKKTYRMMRDKLAALNLATTDSKDDSSGDDAFDKTVEVDGSKATIGYSDSPLRDPYDMFVIKAEDFNPDVECIGDLDIPEEMNGAEYKLQFYNYYPELGDDLDEKKKNAVDFINGKYKNARGKTEDPNTYKAGDVLFKTTTCKVTCQHSDGTEHDVTVNGAFNLNEPKSIVKNNWNYYYENPDFKDKNGSNAMKRTSMIPLGIVTLTETKAPGGYEIPDVHSDVGIVVPYYSKAIGRMNAYVYWCHDDPYVQMTNVKHAIHPYDSDDYNLSSKAVYGFSEGSSYVNLGLLKIDKETGKPGRPVNDVLSLKDIKFNVYHADDCPCGSTIKNPLDHDVKVETGEKFEKLELITDDDGCADTVGLNIKDGKDKGVLTKGHNYYLEESETNDVYLLNKQKYYFEIPKSVPDEWKHADGSPALVFPDKEGAVIGWSDILRAKDLLGNENKKKQTEVLQIENTSPNIGIGVQKYDVMLDSSELGGNHKANHGNATLEGHTFVVLNGTKSEIRLHDKKTEDGKGTKIKSIWAHGDHLKNPYNPTYEELYHYAEESDFQVDPDGKGYICAVLTTDEKGYAETVKDLLPLGVYWVIEVDAKITEEGYHDYLVNKLDVGHVGEYEPGGDGVDEEGNPKDTYKLTYAGNSGGDKTASDIDPEGEVLPAAFTQKLKDTEWKDEEKEHAKAEEHPEVPVRGGVEFQKYNWNSDDPYATGDADLSGAHFAIINVSNELVRNKDGEMIPTWKGRGYNGKDDFSKLKWNAVRAAANQYMVQEVVTELVDDPDNRYGAGGKVNLGRTGNQDLPYGDYLIIEIQSPDGYYLNKEWIGYFEIREDKEIVGIKTVTGDDHNMDAERWRGYNNLPMKYKYDAVACRDLPYAMGIAIEKLDKEMKKPFAQGKSSLKGAMYAVINASDHTIATKDGTQVATIQSLSDYSNDAVSFKYLYDIYKNDVRYAKSGGHIVTTFETDHRGFASTDRDALPMGTYYVIEVKASPGYWIDENFVGKVVVRDDNICMAMTDKNNPTKNGSYFINTTYTKGYDGQHSLTESEYQARNKNSYVYEPVKRCDIWFRKLDENGKPKANIPFLISYVSVSNENDDGSNNFETVLESHVIVSDSNGVVTTAGMNATVNEGGASFTYPGRNRLNGLNGFDQYVQNGAITREGEYLLKSSQASKMSIYFQGNSSDYPKDGEINTWGALYPGYYRITELHCEANKDNAENLLFSQRVYIENTSDGLNNDLSMSYTELMSERDKNNNQMKVLPTMIDRTIDVVSKATDADFGTKTISCAESVRVKDTVTLKGVEEDTKYKLCVQFRDMTDGGKPLKIVSTEGEFNKVSDDRLWVEHEFYPYYERGSKTDFVPEEVYATINTKGLNGHTIMAVDFLYEWVDESNYDNVDGDWVLVKIHPTSEDDKWSITRNASQELYVPDLHTKASDKFSRDRVGSKREDDVILDTVYYEGLTSGTSYGIWMDVVDSVTGESLGGHTVGIDTPTGIISVNATEAGKPFSGTVNMKEYLLDSSTFEDKSGVVIEKLYRVDPTTGQPVGDPILEHSSLLDEDQTIRWPDIHTTASDKNTKCDVGTNEKSAFIYDKVDLHNLIFDKDDHKGGYVYYLRGKLVYQKDFVGADGKEHRAGEEVALLDGSMTTVKITCDTEGNLKAEHLDFIDIDDYDDDGEYQYDKEVMANATITSKRFGYNVANKVNPKHEYDNQYVEDRTSLIADMSVELVFKCNSLDLAGGTTVAFEYLYHDADGGNTNEVSKHTDLTDENQSIHYVDVKTSAVDKKTGDSVGTVGHNTSVVDTVTLTNLVIGREYKVVGTLKDQETGEDFLVNGKKQVQTAFVKVNRYGEIEVNGGTNPVVTEIDKDYHYVSGTIDLTFTFDSTAVEGKTLVVFEDVYYHDVKIAVHNDINDKSQTVYIPKVRTTNTDGYTKDHVGTVTDHDLYEEAVINDEVKYWNLFIGKEYTINGVLMNKDTGEPLLDADGNEIRQSYTFIAGEESDIVKVTKRDTDKGIVDGSVIITFRFDGRLMEGVTTVAFEELVHNGIVIATHTYLEDEEQTVHFPKIRTSAMDKNTVDEVGVVGKTTLTDSVQFWNIIPGETYTVIGTLMDKATGEPILVDGKKVTSSDFIRIRQDGTVDHDNCITCDCGCNVVNGKPCKCDHVPVTVTYYDRDNNRVNGWIDINFEFDASALEGKDIVVFEEMYHNGIKVCEHKDINDLGQTVHFPKIRTTAVDYDTSTKAGTLEETVTIVDTVKYWNLVIGKEYTVKGILMNQETGEPIINSDGQYVEAKATFEITREGGTDNKVLKVHEEDLSVDGEFTIRFTFDSRQLPDESVVVFEDLYHHDVLVTTHHELRDHDQTVHYPSIHTTAVDKNTGSHVGSIYGSWINAIRKLFGEKDLDGNDIPDDQQQNIVDTVTLTNLVPGLTYAVAGKLYNVSESLKKGKNVPLLIDGKEITQYAVITVAKDGSSITSLNGEKTTVIKYNPELDRVDGTVDLTYSLDSSRIQGVEIVVFEDLYQDVTYTPDGVITLDEKDIIARHEDINDKNQSISEVRMHTVAKSTSTADEVGVVPGVSETFTQDVIRDEISFEKLVPNENYTVRGVLVNIDASDFANGIVKYLKEDGTLTDDYDEAYKEEMSFTAHEPDETHYMDFKISSEKVMGMRLTVFEELWYYWTCETGEHHEAKVSMHPQSPYGWDYSWSTDAILETIYYPEIHTNAIDVDTGDNSGTNADQSVVVDKVTYTNLVIGREYTLRGTLMNQDSGMPVLDNYGNAMTQEVTFTAVAEEDEDNPDNHITEVNETAKVVSGEYTIRFVLDTRLLAGQSAVVFEELYHNGLRVCVHTDLYDKAQTVHYPEIHTSARDSETGDHVGSIWGALINSARRFFGEKDVDGNGIPDDKEQVIIDRVTLENLVPGKTYIVTGKLYDKNQSVEADARLPLFIDGKEITNAVTITVAEDGSTITAADGSEAGVTYYSEQKDRVTGYVDVKFVFDGSKVDGKAIVVFEKLYHDSTYDETTSPENPKKEDLVHSHENIDDEDQTVTNVKIHTMAVDGETKDHVGLVSDKKEYSAIVDTVKLSGLVPGMTYKVKGFLVDMKASDFEHEKPMYYMANGSTSEHAEDGVSTTIEFTALKFEETHQLEFAVKSDKVAGKSITVFENLYHNDVLISMHPSHDGTEWNDQAIADQTVHYPLGKTNATDQTTGTHTSISGLNEKRIITDRVYFENLLFGEEYAIRGTLHYQEDFIDAEGNKHKAGDVVEGVAPTTVKLIPQPGLKEGWYDDGSGKPAPITDFETTVYVDGQKAGSGYIDLEFEVDMSKLAGAKIVAFETFYYKLVEVFIHADLTDKAQTITVPKISTSAKSLELDEAAVKNEDGTYRDIEIVDTVTYENLWSVADLDAMADAGEYIKYDDGTYRSQDNKIFTISENATYIVRGVLMNKVTGEPLKNIKGETYVAESEPFVAYEPNGTIDVVFTVNVGDLVDEDRDTLQGKSLVVFEDLYQAESSEEIDTSEEETHIGIHHDIDDEEQDIRFPEIRTHATDGENGTSVGYHPSENANGIHEVLASENMTITDTVSFENLHWGEKYTITGTLQVVTEFDSNGKPVKWETAKDADGNVITASKEFDTRDYDHVGDSVSGTVDLVFKFNGLHLAGKTIVAFEKLERKGILLAVHADITDEPQTIFVPKIHTNASDLFTGFNEMSASKKSVVLDEVTYENLEAGKTYIMKAALHRKSDGSEIPGTELIGTFIAGLENQYILPDGTYTGTIEEIRELIKPQLENVSSSTKIDLDGKVEYVVGRDIQAGYYKITPGNDSGFGYWAIYYDESGEVPTERTEGSTLSNGVVSAGNMTDYIKLENNMVLQLATWCDTQYEQITEEEVGDNLDTALFLYYQARDLALEEAAKNPSDDSGNMISHDGIKLRGDGNRVSGSVFMVIPVDTSQIAGDAVVAFEQLWVPLDKGEKVIAIHEDLDDEDQTVYIPEIRTHATIDGDKTAVVSDDMTVVDTVTYKGLRPGQEYILSGELMDKETGFSTGVTSEMRFTPETSSGSVELEFRFDGTDLVGKQLVVFETLSREDGSGNIYIVAEHKDIEDAAQTVSIQSPPIDIENPIPIVDAGDIALWVYAIGFVIVALLLVLLVVLLKKRSKESDDKRDE